MSKCLSVGGLLVYRGSWKKTALSRYVPILYCDVTFSAEICSYVMLSILETIRI